MMSCISFAQSEYQDLNAAKAPCYFAPNSTYADVCLLKRSFNHLGLSYGSSLTQAIEIQIIRADNLSEANLKKFMNSLVVEIETSEERKFVSLPIEVVDSKIVATIESADFSPLYISSVVIKTKEGAHFINLIKDLFGSKAFAVASGVGR